MYKCNAQNHSHQVNYGDWNDVFTSRSPMGWGYLDDLPDLNRLRIGDLLLAYQTDRNELVGVAFVKGFKKKAKRIELVVQPIKTIGAKVRPMKRSSKAIAKIPALQPGEIKTIYDISRSDAEALLEASAKPAYYIVNTDTQAPLLAAHESMMREHKVAAYFDPWNKEIDRLLKGDVVFLYQSRNGIVAVGKASGRVSVLPCKNGKWRDPKGEHSMKLRDFIRVEPVIPAEVIRAVSKYSSGTGVVLRPTVIRLRPEAGERLQRLAEVSQQK